MFQELKLDTSFLNAILDNVNEKVNFECSFKFHYNPKNGHSDKLDLTDLMQEESKKLIQDEVVQYSGSYYVYVIKQSGKYLYVGKSADIKNRIKNHFLKQNDGTKSKIEKVYGLLNDQENTTFECVIIKLNDKDVYALVEGLLIKKFNTYEAGWNERNDS